MSSIDYKINSATLEDIQLHLEKCNTQFSPALSTYVNIEDYSKKIKLNATLLEAWKENELIGLIACYLNDQNKKNGYITNVSILQTEQGKGISKTLLNQTIQESQDRGFEIISLEVDIRNSTAINLYKKFNFYFSERIGNKQKMVLRLQDKDDTLVSICCITYNHAKYIQQTIKGFLSQMDTCPIEILIHDDSSTDGTADIIKSYEQKYPHIIKPIYQTENQFSKGVSISATYNWPRSRGKYIAQCEGDDYWIDPCKLQKQVLAMEHNPQIKISFHPAETINGRTDETIGLMGDLGKENVIVDAKTILKLGLSIMPTCSLLIQTSFLKDLEIENFMIKYGSSFFLKFLPASSNGALYLHQPMSIYRVNSHGSHTERVQKNFNLALKYYKSVNKAFDISNRFTEFKYNNEIQSIKNKRGLVLLSRADIPIKEKLILYCNQFHLLTNKERFNHFPILGTGLTRIKTKLKLLK